MRYRLCASRTSNIAVYIFCRRESRISLWLSTWNVNKKQKEKNEAAVAINGKFTNDKFLNKSLLRILSLRGLRLVLCVYSEKREIRAREDLLPRRGRDLVTRYLEATDWMINEIDRGRVGGCRGPFVLPEARSRIYALNTRSTTDACLCMRVSEGTASLSRPPPRNW